MTALAILAALAVANALDTPVDTTKMKTTTDEVASEREALHRAVERAQPASATQGKGAPTVWKTRDAWSAEKIRAASQGKGDDWAWGGAPEDSKAAERAVKAAAHEDGRSSQKQRARP